MLLKAARENENGYKLNEIKLKEKNSSCCGERIFKARIHLGKQKQNSQTEMFSNAENGKREIPR